MLAMCSRLNLEMDCPLPQVSPTVAPALAMNFGQNKRHNSWKRTTESEGERDVQTKRRNDNNWQRFSISVCGAVGSDR